MKLLNIALLLTALIGLSSCGYQVGNTKPTELAAVKRLAVPLATNHTQEQRLSSMMTNSLIDTITRDGTYTISNDSNADATLYVDITEIKYVVQRYDPFDSLRASEMFMYLKASWRVVDNQNNLLSKGREEGRTQFTIESNQQTSRSNAFPSAAEATAVLITQRIANGF
ncbi:LPS assembly lipoprotein LptE [Rubritalea marina]|uniref:LPS assembly lipoprotein LptE n=1 Tax=Rubritalea marina TaxID=361055 RepID=UPI000360332F|nr:LPS assembly lipoprotein LptE [Rubritalea marina]